MLSILSEADYESQDTYTTSDPIFFSDDTEDSSLIEVVRMALNDVRQRGGRLLSRQGDQKQYEQRQHVDQRHVPGQQIS
ncbi:MAG TPA: hypothetical protein VHL11_24425 [Phototrophicaceae bacterium]|jgi:hypothetical protein|nr:hypothetical protein [Phototrophicaceae bacterium]